MSHQPFPHWIPADRRDFTHAVARPPAVSRWRKLRTVLALWRARSRQRQHLREIADWDAYILKDIGVSRDAARREAAKFFWQE